VALICHGGWIPISSRKPDDLPEFCWALLAVLASGGA
jgi:hypothetical protein